MVDSMHGLSDADGEDDLQIDKKEDGPKKIAPPKVEAGGTSSGHQLEEPSDPLVLKAQEPKARPKKKVPVNAQSVEINWSSARGEKWAFDGEPDSNAPPPKVGSSGTHNEENAPIPTASAGVTGAPVTEPEHSPDTGQVTHQGELNRLVEPITVRLATLRELNLALSHLDAPQTDAASQISESDRELQILDRHKAKIRATLELEGAAIRILQLHPGMADNAAAGVSVYQRIQNLLAEATPNTEASQYCRIADKGFDGQNWPDGAMAIATRAMVVWDALKSALSEAKADAHATPADIQMLEDSRLVLREELKIACAEVMNQIKAENFPHVDHDAMTNTTSLSEIEEILSKAKEKLSSGKSRIADEERQDGENPTTLASLDSALGLVRTVLNATRVIEAPEIQGLVQQTRQLNELSAGGHLRAMLATAIPGVVCATLHAAAANGAGQYLNKYFPGYDPQPDANNFWQNTLASSVGLGAAIYVVNNVAGPLLRHLFVTLGQGVLAKVDTKEAFPDATNVIHDPVNGPTLISDQELKAKQAEVVAKRDDMDKSRLSWTYGDLFGHLTGMVAYGAAHGVRQYLGGEKIYYQMMGTFAAQLLGGLLMASRQMFHETDGVPGMKLETDPAETLKEVMEGFAKLDPRKEENWRGFFNGFYSATLGLIVSSVPTGTTTLLAQTPEFSKTGAHAFTETMAKLMVLVHFIFAGYEHDEKGETTRGYRAGVSYSPENPLAPVNWGVHAANPFNMAKKYMPYLYEEQNMFRKGVAIPLGYLTSLTALPTKVLTAATTRTGFTVAKAIKNIAYAIWSATPPAPDKPEYVPRIDPPEHLYPMPGAFGDDVGNMV